MKSKTANNTKEADSLQAVDGRTGRTKTVKRKWWGVEYETNDLGFERSERMTKVQASKAAFELGKACNAWVVEVVERRRRIQAFGPTCSPITVLGELTISPKPDK